MAFDLDFSVGFSPLSQVLVYFEVYEGMYVLRTFDLPPPINTHQPPNDPNHHYDRVLPSQSRTSYPLDPFVLVQVHLLSILALHYHFALYYLVKHRHLQSVISFLESSSLPICFLLNSPYLFRPCLLFLCEAGSEISVPTLARYVHVPA